VLRHPNAPSCTILVRKQERLPAWSYFGRELDGGLARRTRAQLDCAHLTARICKGCLKFLSTAACIPTTCNSVSCCSESDVLASSFGLGSPRKGCL